jgi:hypothetical protein
MNVQEAMNKLLSTLTNLRLTLMEHNQIQQDVAGLIQSLSKPAPTSAPDDSREPEKDDTP